MSFFSSGKSRSLITVSRNSYIAKSLIGIIWVVDVSAILKIDMNFNFRTDIKLIFESDIATSAGNIS